MHVFIRDCILFHSSTITLELHSIHLITRSRYFLVGLLSISRYITMMI